MAPAGLVSDGRRTLRLRADLRWEPSSSTHSGARAVIPGAPMSGRTLPGREPDDHTPTRACPETPSSRCRSVDTLYANEKNSTPAGTSHQAHTRTRRPRSVSRRQPRIAVGTIPPRKAVVDPSAHLANMRTQRVSIAASAEVRVRLLGGKLVALATQIPPQIANLSLECGLPR
jgi:hypothetical protein